MPVDWDKLRIFHAAAEAGSFTHAADELNLSQSAISRQVSALEADIGVPLFRRHARGLILTEQGEILFQTAHDVLLELETVRKRLTETTDRPAGTLRVTTTMGFGTGWLTDTVKDFVDQYPELNLDILLDNEELDINMRAADCAIRLRQPKQPDLIQRKLFTAHFHVYAAPSYLARFGEPSSLEQLADHRLITFGDHAPAYLRALNFLEKAGLPNDEPRHSNLRINSILSIKRAVQLGIGIAMLPDYVVEPDTDLVEILTDTQAPSFDCFFVYPEELKSSAKLKVFRDFLFTKARAWHF